MVHSYFHQLDPKEYEVNIQMLGYEDWNQCIDIQKNLDLGIIQLTQEANIRGEIQVIAHQ